jgi:hypothetical protein
MKETNDISQLKESLYTSQFKIEWFLPRLFFQYNEDLGVFDFTQLLFQQNALVY